MTSRGDARPEVGHRRPSSANRRCEAFHAWVHHVTMQLVYACSSILGFADPGRATVSQTGGIWGKVARKC